MSYIEDMRQRMLIGQVGILAYSLAAAFLGKTWKTFVLAFLVIILVQLSVSRRGKDPMGQAKARPEEVLDAPKLFEESKAYELQMEDKQFIVEMQQQSKFTMYTSMGMIVSILYFMLLWKYVDNLYMLFLSTAHNDRIAWFLAFLVYFEGLFVINQLSMIWALRRIGKMPIIQVARSYTVTPKGIVISGIIGKNTVRFPLPEDARIRVDEKRRFVEIVRHGKRTVTRIRLYTRRTRRLADIIKKYGRVAEED